MVYYSTLTNICQWICRHFTILSHKKTGRKYTNNCTFPPVLWAYPKLSAYSESSLARSAIYFLSRTSFIPASAIAERKA